METVWERLGNLILGAGFAGWAIRAVFAADEFDRFSPVRLGLAGLQIFVGILLAIRDPLKRGAGWPAWFATLPSLLLGGVAISLLPKAADWPWPALALFAGGLALTVAGFAALGRSFCILPGERSIVTWGPYALIRHPAYAGELLILGSVFTAAPSWNTGGVLLLILPALVWRIVVEEEFLRQNDEYRAYTEQVPWRLVPGIW